MDVQLYGTGLSVNVTVLSGAKSVRVIVRDSTQKRYTDKGEMLCTCKWCSVNIYNHPVLATF